jgi:carbonic anhydrase
MAQKKINFRRTTVAHAKAAVRKHRAAKKKSRVQKLKGNRKCPTSVIDEVLAANELYSRTHELRRQTPRPERKLAVLTCMDTRLSIRTLGLKTGDAHIIRNAGGIVTDDTLRSLLVSHYLLGTEEFMVINHTDCGLMSTTEEDLRARIEGYARTAAVTPAHFYAFRNVDENVRQQLQKLRTHPWVPKTVAIRGFVYDVATGLLHEIQDA